MLRGSRLFGQHPPLMSDASDHPAALDPEALERACSMRKKRASGPGGQHRNKTETAVELEHGPTGARAAASEARSQAENRKRALRRLRLRLAVTVRRDWPAGREPSALWRSRAGGGRIAVNPRHADYPALLAEALDALAACEWRPSDAAALLGCSGSQLTKLVKQEPDALERVNAERKRRGRGPIH